MLEIDPTQPLSTSRDRFILSKGHAPVLLQVLARKGFYVESLIETFGNDGSYFHEHPPKPGILAGVEAATGSGAWFFNGDRNGKSIKDSKIKNSIYCLLGDGEINEGVIWEGALLAPMLKLNNLVGFIDYNKWQATGRSNGIMNIKSIEKKWTSFGWNTKEVDGHNIREIYEAIELSKSMPSNAPTMIICHTIKGKGVSFMEDNNNWHYKTPNEHEFNQSISELEGKNEEYICKDDDCFGKGKK